MLDTSLGCVAQNLKRLNKIIIRVIIYYAKKCTLGILKILFFIKYILIIFINLISGIILFFIKILPILAFIVIGGFVGYYIFEAFKDSKMFIQVVAALASVSAIIKIAKSNLIITIKLLLHLIVHYFKNLLSEKSINFEIFRIISVTYWRKEFEQYPLKIDHLLEYTHLGIAIFLLLSLPETNDNRELVLVQSVYHEEKKTTFISPLITFKAAGLKNPEMYEDEDFYTINESNFPGSSFHDGSVSMSESQKSSLKELLLLANQKCRVIDESEDMVVLISGFSSSTGYKSTPSSQKPDVDQKMNLLVAAYRELAVFDEMNSVHAKLIKDNKMQNFVFRRAESWNMDDVNTRHLAAIWKAFEEKRNATFEKFPYISFSPTLDYRSVFLEFKNSHCNFEQGQSETQNQVAITDN